MPEVPTLASLAVIVGILAIATATSVHANRRDQRRRDVEAAPEPAAGAEREPARP